MKSQKWLTKSKNDGGTVAKNGRVTVPHGKILKMADEIKNDESL
jgi:hypothetical protein